ncbi:2OG-Fe(II) oxygenase [Gemmata sp.]|uniref:2OG-Fe(II) oxygenase n=1 Tax=Gemmata sp. TaxID=1914242 RepID=UPI003F714856
MRKELLDGEQVFVIHDFLSPGECADYVRVTEAVGYAAAPITTPSGPLMAPSVRNNERVMIDNREWAAELWERARPLVPSPFRGREATGLNERFRFYRYEAGQAFRPHTDAHFARGDERSQLTFMVYLGGDCTGGDTVIHIQDDGERLADGDVIRVAPEAGKALVFYHYLLHEGAAVAAGRKYVLRSDVMYRVPGHE